MRDRPAVQDLFEAVRLKRKSWSCQLLLRANNQLSLLNGLLAT